MDSIGRIIENIGFYPLLVGIYSVFIYGKELWHKLPLTTSSTTSAFHISAIASVYLTPALGGPDVLKNLLIVYGTVGATLAGTLLLSVVLRRNRGEAHGALLRWHLTGKGAGVFFLLAIVLLAFVLILPFFASGGTWFDPHARGAAILILLFGSLQKSILFFAAMVGATSLLRLPELWRSPPDAKF